MPEKKLSIRQTINVIARFALIVAERQNAAILKATAIACSDVYMSSILCYKKDSGIAYILDKGKYVREEAELEEKSNKEAFEHAENLAEKSIRDFSDRREGLKEVTEKMRQSINNAAKSFLREFFLYSPIIVRFHNDVDGASGAAAFCNAINELELRYNMPRHEILYIPQRNVFYSSEDAEADISFFKRFKFIGKGAIVNIDFGTSPESTEGIRKIESFEVFWIDHHPVEGFERKGIRHYLNPWLYKGDSNYTGGYLASKFVEAFSTANNKIFEEASLIGDFSVFANPTKEARELAGAIDLLTTDKRFLKNPENGISPKEVLSLAEDEKRRKELFVIAEDRIEEAILASFGGMKEKYVNECAIYTIDFDVLDDEVRYPGLGRFATKVYEKLSSLVKSKVVIIAYAGKYISIRADSSIRWFNSHRLIDELRSAGFKIETGGGHTHAGAIKALYKEDVKDMARFLSRTVEKIARES
ncbi:MAG: hypothetical protein QXL16_00110 [Candidatus Micrarchaeaceae archaeon]